jgi:hypothetical protein
MVMKFVIREVGFDDSRSFGGGDKVELAKVGRYLGTYRLWVG